MVYRYDMAEQYEAILMLIGSCEEPTREHGIQSGILDFII